MQPRTFGPYTVLSVLGVAGFGRVHLGRTDKGRRVAVRVIRPEFAADPRFRACLQKRWRSSPRIRGPRVAALLGGDLEADVPWLAAEYVPAPSLATVLAQCGPLSVDGVRRLGVELAEALTTIHGAGAVHHDLQPGNVLITADGPRVVDAGIARAAAASPLTRGGGLVGTPGYLAPEQLLNGSACLRRTCSPSAACCCTPQPGASRSGPATSRPSSIACCGSARTCAASTRGSPRSSRPACTRIPRSGPLRGRCATASWRPGHAARPSQQ